MSFEHALYYPWIDINNSEWLKTAVLYWDKISTIVPEGMNEPYENVETQYLKQEGIVSPYEVYSGSEVVKRTGDTFLAYLNSDETQALLARPQNINGEDRQKCEMVRIYTGKMTYETKMKLLTFPRIHDNGDYLEMDKQTADYYMDLLAAEVSQKEGYALVTDSISNENISNKVRRGDSDLLGSQYLSALRQGMIARLVFHGVKIAPGTPIEKLLEFRYKRAAELLRFRSEMDDIDEWNGTEIKSINELNLKVADLYSRKISPTINSLRKSLDDLKIETASGFLITCAVASIPNLGNLETSINSILIEGALSLAVSAAMYHRSKKRKLEVSPWSYVLSAERHLR